MTKEVGHVVSPSVINFRANIYGLRQIGVKRILASSSCGSINPSIEPGSLIILDQFIDLTKSRQYTFYDGKTSVKVWPDKPPIKAAVHVDMTQPYCPELRNVLIRACKKVGLKFHKHGCYICSEGPRFETLAEIKAFRLLGADVVGMTNVPESVLARELAICYAVCAVSTNWAAGVKGAKITHNEVIETFRKAINKLSKVFRESIRTIPEGRKCQCKDALVGAIAK